MKRPNTLRIAILAALYSSGPTLAEVVFDGTVGAPGAASFNPTTQTYTLGQDRGTLSGTNLFHSFGSFNIGQGQTAAFTQSAGNAPGTITNVISRVTGIGVPGGLQPTTIDGLVRSDIPNASFWFINPAGITVGPTGAIDVSGAIALGAADFIQFSDGQKWFALGNGGANPSMLAVNPFDFGFLDNSAAGALTIRSTDLLTDATELPEAQQIDAKSFLVPTELVDPDGNVSATGFRAVGPFSRLWTGRAGVVLDSSTDLHLVDVKVATGNAEINGSGNISISAAGTITLQGSFIDAENFGFGSGPKPPSGSVSVQAPRVNVLDSAFQTVSASGSGDITIRATGSDTATPALNLVRSSLNSGSRGSFGDNSGTIDLSVAAGTLALTDSTISTNAGAAATASGAINLSGQSIDVSGGLISSLTLAESNDAGPVTLTATGADRGDRAAIRIRDGVLISTSTRSLEERVKGNGGTIAITANQGTLQITGPRTAVSSASGTKEVNGQFTGNAGSVFLNARDVEISNSARVVSTVNSNDVTSPDRPGVLSIDAQRGVRITSGSRIESLTTDAKRSLPGSPGRTANSIHIGGASVLLDDSTVTASTVGTGDAGNIEIVGGQLLIRSSVVEASTITTGSAGDIDIRATGSASISRSTVNAASTGGDDVSGSIRIVADGVLIEEQSLISANYNNPGGNPGGAGAIVVRATGSSSAEARPQTMLNAATSGVVRIVDSGVTSTNIGGAQGNQSGAGTITIGADLPGASGEASRTDSVVIAGSLLSTSVAAGGRSSDIVINGTRGVWIQDSANGYRPSDPVIQANDSRADVSRSLIASSTQQTALSGGNVTIRGGTLGVTLQRSDVDTTNDLRAFDGNGVGFVSSVALHAVGGEARLDGALVSTDTTGINNAGDIQIAGNTVHISGGQISAATRTALDDSSGAQVVGSAGSIAITASADSRAALLLDQAAVVRSDASAARAIRGSDGAPIAVPNSSNVMLAAAAGTVRVEAGSALRTLSGPDAGAAGSISVSGRAVELDAALLQAASQGSGNAGNIDVLATGAAGVSISGQSSLTSDASAARAVGSQATLRLPDAGQITVRAMQGAIDVRGQSELVSSAGALAGQAGMVQLDAASSLALRDVRINTSVESSRTTGEGGAALATASIALRSGGATTLTNTSLASETSGAVDAGSIAVNAATTLTIDNSRLTASTNAQGDAGRITLGGQSVTVQAGQITTSTVGAGDAGDITLSATGTSGTSDHEALRILGGAQLTSTADGTAVGIGNAGLISLNSAGAARVQSSDITSSAGSSAGSAGQVSIRAANDLILQGATVRTTVATNTSQLTAAEIALASNNGAVVLGGGTTVDATTSGNTRAGNIVISGRSALIESTAVSSRTTAGASAGAICVASGATSCSSASGMQSTAVAKSLPAAGAVTIRNSTLSTSTAAAGTAGDISVLGGGGLSLSGATLQSASSSQLPSAGKGGSINLSTQGGGTFAIQSSLVQTNTAGADAGTITLDANGSALTLRDARVVASAGGAGDGANIVIMDAGQTLMQRSAVLAQAVGGDGGNITINLQPGAVFVRDSQSIISASSDAGNDGQIDINSPDTNLNPAVRPQEVDNASQPELSNNPCAGPLDARSTFARETRGGVPTRPDDYLASTSGMPAAEKSASTPRPMQATQALASLQDPSAPVLGALSNCR